MRTQTEWAQLAAYVDGEGCISISAKSRKQGRWGWQAYELVMRVTNTDPRLPNWCHARFGGKMKVVYPKNYRNKNYRACFAWEIYGKSCKEVLLGMLPYTVIKREQIEIALSYLETMEKTYHRHTMPESVKIERTRLYNALKSARNLEFLSEASLTTGELPVQ